MVIWFLDIAILISYRDIGNAAYYSPLYHKLGSHKLYTVPQQVSMDVCSVQSFTHVQSVTEQSELSIQPAVGLLTNILDTLLQWFPTFCRSRTGNNIFWKLADLYLKMTSSSKIELPSDNSYIKTVSIP